MYGGTRPVAHEPVETVRHLYGKGARSGWNQKAPPRAWGKVLGLNRQILGKGPRFIALALKPTRKIRRPGQGSLARLTGCWLASIGEHPLASNIAAIVNSKASMHHAGLSALPMRAPSTAYV